MTRHSTGPRIGTPPSVCFLNIGCGRRFSRDERWLNVDLAPAAPRVVRIDAQHGLPFADASFLAVYHSHVLEHLDRDAGRRLLLECHRILKPGGILRVAVPNLEEIARCYLARLDEARAGKPGADGRYQWAVAEVFDQMVRRQPGGDMLELLRTRDGSLREYAIERCGAEVAGILSDLEAEPAKVAMAGHSPFSVRRIARALRERCQQWVLGREFDVLLRARFRESGEIHRWMYDEYSLRQSLTAAGFADCRRHQADSSGIADWVRYEIDADAAGAPFKPDSLFMEGMKPLAGTA